ncbi:hypothetical protein HELRODRAFT_162556 [Helobdella robusta]|uniref:Uncharacterized protein n=1 Tax=Helobdella robusta TaxID=6412 RepID=T1ESU1_HELRO|nr:hypothetical protein HELRODRAFT_162556 [Helobdella robusta]ESN99072.1 hypothetical protein HELRODRAFT_162556 [Helobdella robusta]
MLQFPTVARECDRTAIIDRSKLRAKLTYEAKITLAEIHLENILTAMLLDDRKEIKEVAAGQIKFARKATAPGKNKIRKFQCPSLNFEPAIYYCLLNWQDDPRTSPPMLREISDDKIKAAIKVPRKWALEKYPCHYQSVEQHV